jgi:hypothetical protein
MNSSQSKCCASHLRANLVGRAWRESVTLAVSRHQYASHLRANLVDREARVWVTLLVNPERRRVSRVWVTLLVNPERRSVSRVWVTLSVSRHLHYVCRHLVILGYREWGNLNLLQNDDGFQGSMALKDRRLCK